LLEGRSDKVIDGRLSLSISIPLPPNQTSISLVTMGGPQIGVSPIRSRASLGKLLQSFARYVYDLISARDGPNKNATGRFGNGLWRFGYKAATSGRWSGVIRRTAPLVEHGPRPMVAALF